jgi:hypothetical protein
MIRLSRRYGLQAVGYNEGTLEELASLTDRGIPVQVLLDTTPGNDTVLHWVAVDQVVRDTTGAPRRVIYMDPALGLHDERSPRDFLRAWENVKIFDVATGFDRFYIAHARRGTSLPPGRMLDQLAVMLFLGGLKETTNGVGRLIAGNPDGFLQALGGAVGTVITVPGVAADAGGHVTEGFPVLHQFLETTGVILALPAWAMERAWRALRSPFAWLFDG